MDEPAEPVASDDLDVGVGRVGDSALSGLSAGQRLTRRLFIMINRAWGRDSNLVGAENRVTLRDLPVLMDESAETITSKNPETTTSF
jgi:hypothetical protein